MAEIECNEDLICKYILIDEKGTTLPIDTANYFKTLDTFVIVYFNWNNISVYNKNCSRIIAENFSEIHEFRDNLSAVKRENKWGYLGKSGKITIPFKFDEASDFFMNFALVKINSKYNYIDTSGVIVKTVPDKVKSHFNRFGISTFATTRVEQEFEHSVYEIFPAEPYFAKKGIRNKCDHTVVLPDLYSYVSECSGDYAVVIQNSNYGVYNMNERRFIVELKYSRINILEVK